MRLPYVSLALVVALLICSNDAHGQTRRRLYGDLATRDRAVLGGQHTRGLEGRRVRGRMTRGDLLRKMTPLQRQHEGLLDEIRRPHNPIRLQLENRNLLRTRSPLGRRSTSALGQYTVTALPETQPAPNALSLSPRLRRTPTELPKLGGDASSQATPERSYTSLLEQQIARQADEHFELGVAYFRHRAIDDAEKHFMLARESDPNSPRGYIGIMFVAYEQGEINTAISSLLTAVKRAETIDDLGFDNQIERLFESQREFERALDSLTVFARTDPSARAVHLLLAYYSWLAGDIDTAIASTEEAEAVLGEDYEPIVRRFRELLVDARDRAFRAEQP